MGSRPPVKRDHENAQVDGIGNDSGQISFSRQIFCCCYGNITRLKIWIKVKINLQVNQSTNSKQVKMMINDEIHAW